MLIVWRRSGQGLIIGEEGVEIEVLEARPNRVKLGIVAPPQVSIVRSEARTTRRENVAAALSAGHEMIETILRGFGDNQAEPSASNASGRQIVDDAEQQKNPSKIY